MVKDVNPKEAQELMKGVAVVVDVRTAGEHRSENLGEELNLDIYQDFHDRIQELDKEKTYLVYCRTGSRSYHAARIMEELGFRDVYNLKGGIKGWKSSGYSTA